MASREEKAAVSAEFKAAVSLDPLEDGDEFDDDDEADFDPCDDHGSSEEDEGDYDDDDESEDDENEENVVENCCILNGTIHLNDEGRVIFSGTWCMKSEIDGSKDGSLRQSEGDRDSLSRHKQQKFKLKSQEVCYPFPMKNGNSKADASHLPEDRSSKETEGNEATGTKEISPSKSSRRRRSLFDVNRPTLSKIPSSSAASEPSKSGSTTAEYNKEEISNAAVSLPSRRTMIFDGFFFESFASPSTETMETKDKHRHHGKKIRERDVEIFFSAAAQEGGEHHDRAHQLSSSAPAYRFAGRGYNEYGPFVLEGTYSPPHQKNSCVNNSKKENSNEEGTSEEHKNGNVTSNSLQPSATVICRKTYGAGGNAKETRSNRDAGKEVRGTKRRKKAAKDDGDDEDDDDDYNWNEERADFSELIELTEDAGLSIEDLRKKYYGGSGFNSRENGGLEEAPVEGESGEKVPAAKKPRIEEESDDEECGF